MSMYDFYANNGYHRLFNNHGLKSLDRGVNIPDADLAIGAAEVTRSIPMTVAYQPIMRAPEPTAVRSIEDTYIKTQGNALELSSFSRSGYYGLPLGGV